MIEVRCFDRLSQAEPYRYAINALNLVSAKPDPFSTFEFYQNYLRNPELFPAGAKLQLLLAFADDVLIGYLALKQCTHRVLGLRAAKLDLLTAHQGDRPQMVVRRELARPVRAAMYAYLLSHQQDWSLLEFPEQDAASTLLPPPAEAISGACQLQKWPNMANGTIPIRWNSTAGYFAALSKKARSNVSRQMRTLLAAGEVQVLTSSDPQALAALFVLYQSIETHSWKDAADATISRDARTIEYYAGLMHPSQPMRVWIQVLLLDGVPIAGLISGSFNKGMYALHIVYDDRLAHLAPGSAILLMGMRLAIETGCEFFNLLRGFAYYKERWLAQMSETQSLQIYRVGTPYYWRRVLGDARRFCLGRWLGQAELSARSNPVRSKIIRAVPVDAAASPELLASVAQRERYASLIAQARRGSGEFLSPSQVAAAMPFETSTTQRRPYPRTQGLSSQAVHRVRPESSASERASHSLRASDSCGL